MRSCVWRLGSQHFALFLFLTWQSCFSFHCEAFMSYHNTPSVLRRINNGLQNSHGSSYLVGTVNYKHKRFVLNAITSPTRYDSKKVESTTERFRASLPDFIGSCKLFQNSVQSDVKKEIISSSESSSKIISLEKKSKDLDRKILTVLIPSIINLMVVPLVNSVDTFFVGRIGDALALAGQAAANQIFFSLFFLISFLPTITAPLVAEAVGAKNTEAATDRVCEALFLSNLFGLVGTIFLFCFPKVACSLVLNADAPAAAYAIPYLRLRSLSMIPALISAVGFAAYRGLLSTVTPLKVSLAVNAFNIIADPLLIFGLSAVGIKGIGMKGAAIATAGAEFLSGLTYLRLLFRKKLARWSRILKPPKWKSLFPLIQVGSAMLLRQAILNVSFVSATRCAQSMDPTGVSAAAYSIVMQIYSLGIVVQLAVQATAATLVPSAKAGEGGVPEARKVADRIFGWGALIGILQGIAQVIAVPKIIPLFSPLPEVREAAKFPALITSIIHITNGFIFPGEGCMLGLGTIRDLALITGGGVCVMVACLSSPLGKRIDGIVLSIAAFHFVQAIAMIWHHLRVGPLRRQKPSFQSA